MIGEYLAQVQRTATGLNDIAAGKEGAATIEHARAPVVLVETFQVEGVGDTETERQHLHRQLAFLDLDPGAIEGGDVQRVDDVDAVLNQQRFAPGQHLLAKLDVERMAGQFQVLPQVGV
ncbi:hypothetical protein D3C77_94140 [compost metagenome]